jgi:2-(1,2-epoxy-1,2-dihydrophenyl)acetyl-CoA isomerase
VETAAEVSEDQGDTAPLRLQREAAVAHLTLDRPTHLNTVDLAMAKALLAAARDIAHDSDVRAVLLDGAGRSFCGGGDLKAFARIGDGLPEHLRAVTADLHAAQSLLARLDVPVVVAVHGAAAGAGLGLACLGDVVLAARSARFVFAYTAVGLSPDAGTSWALPRLIGPRRALDLALTNRVVDATEAEQIGLVTRVVPDEDLANEAAKLAGELANGPTAAFGTTKRLLRSGWDASYDDQMARESETLSASARTDDGLEGVEAFAAGRKPKFSGR